MIVLDTSALIDSFQNLECGQRLKQLVLAEEIAAPDILYAETLQSLRKMERLGDISSLFAERSISVLRKLPIKRFATAELLWEVWDLRHNFSAYGACYVVLAGKLNARLLTHDKRLATAAAEHITTFVLF